MVDWFVKDPDAWDLMCGWWVSEDFRAVSRLNRLSKSSVHLYDTDGHVWRGGDSSPAAVVEVEGGGLAVRRGGEAGVEPWRPSCSKRRWGGGGGGRQRKGRRRHVEAFTSRKKTPWEGVTRRKKPGRALERPLFIQWLSLRLPVSVQCPNLNNTIALNCDRFLCFAEGC
jgi:hypothetical protein